jgi:hypothetical protein
MLPIMEQRKVTYKRYPSAAPATMLADLLRHERWHDLTVWA